MRFRADRLKPVARLDGLLSRADGRTTIPFKSRRPMVIVTWMRGEDRKWCVLADLNLASIADVGVYIVWYAGDPGRVVCVGQGPIAAELARVRADDTVMNFAARGQLLVTWAPVSPARIDGVERFVANAWPPLLERPRSDVPPIEVNSPAWLRSFV